MTLWSPGREGLPASEHAGQEGGPAAARSRLVAGKAGVPSRALAVRAERVVNPYAFVVGCPRSGTTLLQRLVDAHPDIAMLDEALWVPSHSERRKVLTP